MIKLFRIVCAIAVAVLSISLLFRICHWPFFQVLIRIASILGLISAIWAMCLRKKLAGASNGKVVMAAISVIVALVGLWFFISHWPGATIILIIGLGILVPVASIWWAYAKDSKNAE